VPPESRDAVKALACAGVLLACAAPVAAQEEAPQQLDDVVVTAQKSEQLIEQVPLSMTVLGGDALAQTGSNDLDGLSPYVPNLRIDGDDPGATSLYIRGFGSNSFNSSIDSGVGFVQDDVYFGRNGYVTDALFDLDRIEVLRGPQGTLFGKNTVAGLVNIVSAAPRDEFGANLSYRKASFGEDRVEGGVDLPLGDWAAARVAGMYRDEQGELYNTRLERDEGSLHQHGARARVRFHPRDSVASELVLLDTDTVTTALPLQLLALDQDTREYLQQFDPRVEDDPLDSRTSFDTAGFIHKGSRTASLKTDWDIGALGAIPDLRATLIVAASRFRTDRLHDIDGSPADLARLPNRVDYRQYSGEFHLSGTLEHGLFGWGESAEFVAGAFAFDSSTTLRTRVLAGVDLPSFLDTCDFRQLVTKDLTACPPGMPVPLPDPTAGAAVGEDYFQFDVVPHTRSAALFGQVSWQLTEHWMLIPALRLNLEDKVADVAGNSHCPNRQAAPCLIETILGAQDYNYHGLRHRETDLSPKLALQYLTEGGDDLYLSYAVGHKSGGFNFATFDGVDIEFQPEVARTWELGAKGHALDHTLRFDVALFDTDFRNLQVFQLGVVTGISNAAAANSRGLEAAVTWLTPVPALSLGGAFGLLDSRYRRYPGAPAPIAQGIGAEQDLSGQRLAFAPRQTGALTPALKFLLGPCALQLSADALYQGDQYTDADLDPNTRVPGYWKFAARVKLGSPDDRWSLTIGGNNLTDERVLNQVTDAILFPQTYLAQAAGGRTVFVTLGARL
jgi:iron complex outermembrane receptor protein